MVQRCVNIDWLELYCLEDMARWPMDAAFFQRDGWHVEQRPYGTRVYSQMFTLYDVHGYPLIEVRRAPYSLKDSGSHGFFEDNACHLRFTNRACYLPHCIDIMRQFLVRYNYTLKKIYRLDVCLDFERFDYGDDPGEFLLRYMRGRYAKINQSHISAHGMDQWDGRQWNSLGWGSAKSMVTTKFYNKTMELTQVKDKPYIRQAWFAAGLIDDYDRMTKRRTDGTIYKPNIWRVEFSIKAGAQRWYVIEDHSHAKVKKTPMPHTLDIYDTPERLLLVFASLAKHYFHFKKYQNGVRKDRCEDKRLFNFLPDDAFYKITHPSNDVPRDHSMETLRRRLETYKLRVVDPEVRNAIDLLIQHISFHSINRTQTDPGDLALTRLWQMVIRARFSGDTDTDAMQLFHSFEDYDGF